MSLVRTIRQKLDIDSDTPLDLSAWRNNSTVFQIAVYQGSTVADISDVESINLKIRPSRVSETILADQTDTVFDETLTNATWLDGTKQHASFTFDNSEMNLDLDDQYEAEFWIVFTAILDGGEERTLATGTITFKEDNNGAGDPPAENPGTAITIDQADARYPQLTDFDEHVADTDNPHEVTKTQVGLSNVDNTSDLNKPISTATQTALDTAHQEIDDEASARSSADSALSNAIDLKLSKSGGTMTGTVYMTDNIPIEWLDDDGNASGAKLRHWWNHDAYGGETILDSPWRIALIPQGPIQLFKNDAGRYPRKLIMSSGAASNANATVNYMPSGALAFQATVWDGAASVRNEIIMQSRQIDTSGTNAVLEIFDEAEVGGQDGGGGIYDSTRGVVTGNLIAGIYREGIYSAGTAPVYETLTDGASITQTVSIYKTVQSAKVTLGGNRTLIIADVVSGMRGVILVTQDGTGSRSLTPDGFSALDLSTTAGYTDRVSWDYDGTYLNFAVQKNIQVTLPSLDVDASAFIAAASITDTTQKIAISNLATQLKAASLWDKIFEIYPFVGGNATAHGIKLKGTGTISWAGTVTHNANGITGNGTTGVGNTGYSFNDDAAQDSAMIYAYCKTTSPTTGRYIMGAVGTSSSRVGMLISGANMGGAGLNSNSIAGAVGASSDFRKHFAFIRTSSSAQLLYANGTSAAVNNASLSACDRDVMILARNLSGTADNFSDANLAMVMFGESMNSTEYATFRGIVDTYQTALSRANP